MYIYFITNLILFDDNAPKRMNDALGETITKLFVKRKRDQFPLNTFFFSFSIVVHP